MDTITVVQIAERVERELERVKAARPALASRVERAGNILVTHLSCRRQRLIRARVNGDGTRFLVSGSGGAVYVVRPQTWECSCPDAHRRGKGCKHALAVWALVRASARPAPRLRECAGCLGRFEGRELVEVGDDHLTFFEHDELCGPCALEHGVL